MTQLKSPPRPKRLVPRMTYEEFLKWDGGDQHVEWVDGEVVKMPPVSDVHNVVGNWLIGCFNEFVAHHRSGHVRSDPYQMKTGPGLPGRAPDIIYVSNRNARRLQRAFLEGPADIVVEIISPDSRTIDRVEKFRDYEQGGVREYWLIDPDRRTVEFYRRGRNGRFEHVPVGPDGVFRSAVARGLWIRTQWLWDRPAYTTVAKEWGLI